MKKTALSVILLIVFMNVIVFSQHRLKLKESRKDSKSGINLLVSPSKNFSKADMPVSYYLAAIINPMLVIEDKKVFFGLTKEVSFGVFPYGRLAFEYSYIFRSYNTSHLRFSYNYDILLAAGDFVGFIATPGVGYFTDTKNKGWFLHGSVGAIMGPGETFIFTPYFRYRHTFISDKNKSDINDISLGVGLTFYF